ncbi:TlpA family protein disulfide reductase [Herbidospora galbida]|uniref:TlpA family protein disulfide reductase n=1 Tax=Herbidospora galbida TaxID=2575442 RepID=A0A4U3MNZ2_9ACTN|nr:TlpA disulfide reductase family protein [Herbidospora galbida]TKK89786.1 TlpA family protein disulfide reductase [Herbidospora galbida]
MSPFSRALIVVCSALVLTGCAANVGGAGQPESDDTRFVAGDGKVQVFDAGDRKPAPVVAGQTLEGAQTTMAKGKVTVINFWASWCAPCRAEGPTLKDVAARTKADGVDFLGINFKDQKAAATAYDAQLTPGYPSIHDQSGKVLLGFSGTVPPAAIPSTLIIDREGRIAARALGAVKYQALLDAVTKVSSESR